MSSYVLGLLTVTIADKCHTGRSTINVLSDDVLIHIFCLHREAVVFSLCGESWEQHEWCALAHVCQRWRHIIFAWPNYLDIKIGCTSRTAAVKALDVWPALPISIHSVLYIAGTPNYGDGNGVIDVLEHRGRITGINLSSLTGPQLEICTTFMQEPFSILRALSLGCGAETPPVISDMFLAGSAPRLQKIKLQGIPFPTLPKFLLSTRDLVELHLDDIPRTGYISPDVMATSLAMLTKLQSVSINFRSRSSFPKNPTTQSPLPQTRTVLPALTEFFFCGVSKYLKDFMTRIRAPRLDHIHLYFFYQPAVGIPQLPQIIHRSKKFKTPREADIVFHENSVHIAFSSEWPIFGYLHLEFERDGLDRQLSLLEQVLSQCFSLLSHVVTLEIHDRHHDMQPDQDSTLWLAFLQPFNAVDSLCLFDRHLLLQIARALGELTEERAAEVLPMLSAMKWFGCDWDEVEPWVTPLLQPFIDAHKYHVEVP